MKNRSKLFFIFEKNYNEIKTQFDILIHCFHSDNAKNISHQFQQFMASKGIIHQISCAYTPQQNCVVERKNRHLIETT